MKKGIVPGDLVCLSGGHHNDKLGMRLTPWDYASGRLIKMNDILIVLGVVDSVSSDDVYVVSPRGHLGWVYSHYLRPCQA